jgi:hypothetical protein
MKPLSARPYAYAATTKGDGKGEKLKFAAADLIQPPPPV